MKRILVAEDDPFIMSVYTSRLKKDGYAVESAVDGKMAWNKIKSNPPNLILLDIGLPFINGYELLKMIRKEAMTKNVKVIILSNLRNTELSEDILKLNVARYLLKVETSLDEIARVVKEILN